MVAILGPTASGKSEVALAIAERMGGEIVSVDSMQVYRRMDIGTAKPSVSEQRRVRHHLIDVVDPDQAFSVAEYQSLGREALEDEAPKVLVGGSGLHFRSLVDPLVFEPSDHALRQRFTAMPPDEARQQLLETDPDAGRHVELANPRRVSRALEIVQLTGRTPSERAAEPSAEAVRNYQAEREFVAVGIDPGLGLRARVASRLDAMRVGGLLEEVRELRDDLGPTAREAVGYKQLLEVVMGSASEETGWQEAERATLSLAKRQRTYFNRDPRVTWLAWSEDLDKRIRQAEEILGV